ncbi:MAG TPA: PaaI family thioesterase [Syntrophomonadaceae bacterium]|nr:PaaI family thioesterase [Syntrophomonadaceae bacterium]
MTERCKHLHSECGLPNTEKPPLPSPPCFTSMEARLLEYDCKKVQVALPVLESYLNPAGTMQGGFISAAFDNVFGPLCLLATGTPHTAALNLSTTYHRPLFQGDELVITATVQSHGKTAIHMIAEGYNQDGKLVATSSTSYIIKQNPK